MADDIAQWLEGIGLCQYAQAFAENGIRFDILPHLTDGDLEKLGLNLGDRRRIQLPIGASRFAVTFLATPLSPYQRFTSSSKPRASATPPVLPGPNRTESDEGLVGRPPASRIDGSNEHVG